MLNSTKNTSTDTKSKSVVFDPEYWQQLMCDPKWMSHAYMVLVDLLDTEALVKELASICYLQLKCDREDLDFVKLIRYSIKRKDAKILRAFFSHMKNQRPFMVDDVCFYISNRADTKGWKKYLK